jgi:outer membrane autotransporter protein
MRLRRVACVLVMMGILAVTVPADAQGLNDVLIRLLSNGCVGLNGSSNTSAFGPQLGQICQGGGAASTAGGSVGAEARGGAGVEQQQVYRRLRQRQGSASADTGGLHGLSLFASVDYQNFDQDTTRFESGFDRDTVGGTIGADYLFSNGMVVGSAVNYGHEFGRYDDGGGFDHDAYGILVYGSFVPITSMFVDAVAGYTRKDYSFDRRASFASATLATSGPTNGDTNGNEFRLGVNAGYDFLLGRFTVGPRVGVLYRETTIDSFRESGSTGLELEYDNQNIQSLTTTVGVFGSVAISTGFGVIVPQASAEYVHEFLDDQRSVGFRLVQDMTPRRFLFQTDRPDRDYFNLGVGVSMVLANGFQPFLNFRELVGYDDRSSHTVNVGLRVPF